MVWSQELGPKNSEGRRISPAASGVGSVFSYLAKRSPGPLVGLGETIGLIGVLKRRGFDVPRDTWLGSYMAQMHARRGQVCADCMALKVGMVLVHLVCLVVLWALFLVVGWRTPPIPASTIVPAK